jgi:hypothetical protein
LLKTKPPIGGLSSNPRLEGACPPSNLAGGGGVSSLWPQKRWERPDRAGGGPPIGGWVEAGGRPTGWVWDLKTIKTEKNNKNRKEKRFR